MQLEFMGLHSGTSKLLEDSGSINRAPPVQNNGSDESVPDLCWLDPRGEDCSGSEARSTSCWRNAEETMGGPKTDPCGTPDVIPSL